jgi:hypothetical protein
MKMICANCGFEFEWQPTIVDGVVYCCIGCSEGGPCTCDYDNLPQPGDRTALASIPQNDEKKRSIRRYEQDCWY